MPTADPSLFASHRQALLDRLGPDEAVLLFSPPHALRNADTEYRYRQDSHLYYLSGWEDPEAVLLLRPGEQPFTLFVQAKDPAREVWTGIRPGPEGARAEYGADRAFPVEDLAKELPELLVGVRTLHYRVGLNPEHDRAVHGAIRAAYRSARERVLPLPDCFVSPERVLGLLRQRKSPAELALLRQAAGITAEAHLAAMAAGGPGRREYELEALIDYTFRRAGAHGPGYGTIVGSGPNACILHHVRNDRLLQAGDLVLVDAGAEVACYTADVTRTWPASGRFTGPQRDLYQVVLDAQLACVEACRPGLSFKELSDLAIRRLTEGMVALGLLQGSVDERIEDKAFRRYYMHGIGHWLGLDVHDAGPYVVEGGSRVLEPGVVLTIEPGIYVPPGDEQVPEAFRGLGVRIEDDVLVTVDAPEVLTSAVPKTVAAVEAACTR